MKKPLTLTTLLLAVLSPTALTALSGCPDKPAPGSTTGAPTATTTTTTATTSSSTTSTTTATAPPTTSNCLAPPYLVPSGSGQPAYTTPKDIALTRQADANCFAWQEFISLSWAASSSMRGQPDTSVPPSSFGPPGDTRPLVWETYKESNEVFLAGGKDPGKWNTWPGGESVKLLGGLKSEVGAKPPLDLGDIGQASEGSPWLTAQNKLLTLYERRMNEDEYNYVVENKLYDADVQQIFVKAPGINLPDGTAASSKYGPLGSIETKASWLELPNPADWPRFKTSKAVVTYPNQQPKTVVVGLVGLHIIHKTALGQQFIWATFEHKDNCPDKTQVAAGTLAPAYTYYNPKCDPKTDHYHCVPNANPVQGDAGTNPYDAPIQVVRETPIASRPNDDVAGLNAYVANLIAAQNKDSVFLNYELVNVLWSNQNTPVTAGSRVPLVAAQLSPGPSQEPVANTTLETYVQSVTCLSCHASAPIASATPPASIKIFDPAKAGSAATAQNPYASDYSFLLGSAQSPGAAKGAH